MPPTDVRTWVGLSADPLPVERAAAWVVVPGCGAVVTFTGTARDHAEGRPGVERLAYEAYDEQAVARMQAVADEVLVRWTDAGRVAILHRTGELGVGDAAVVVAVSTPHRAEAFEAARFAIDTVKATAPIWKKERWAGGDDWAHSEQAAHAGAQG